MRMTHPHVDRDQPQHILLATDLTRASRQPRCWWYATTAWHLMRRRYVLATNTDLTVIDAYPRGLLFDAVIGRSRHIADAIPGDVRVVRATRSAQSQ